MRQRQKRIRLFFLVAMIIIALPSILKLYTGHTGKILIATEKIGHDKHFAQTVIYIFKHSVWGAQGIIINRPIPSSDMDKYHLNHHTGMFFKGGPVDFPNLKIVALNKLNAISHWRTQQLFVLSYDKLHKISSQYIDQDLNIYLGYSGWNTGQLEKEIQDGLWIVEKYDTEIMQGMLASEMRNILLNYK